MKFTLVLLVAAAVLGCVLSCSVAEFEAYKVKYNKVYDDPTENKTRFQIYCKNMERVTKHNQSGSSFKQAMNAFGDMTQEEMKSRLGLRGISRP